MRRDALDRRDALLRAAVECFEEQGFNVRLEVIAERAGVGRGTLYRNFKDRMDLAFAIFEREVERLEATLDTGLPIGEMLLFIVDHGRPTRHLFSRLLLDMTPTGDSLAAFEALGTRLEMLFKPAVDRGIAAGELRADLEPRHVLTAMRMVTGIDAGSFDRERGRQQIDDALDLVLLGLSAR